MLGWTLILLAIVVGVSVGFTARYLYYVRSRRQWWLDHPEASAAHRSRAERS